MSKDKEQVEHVCGSCGSKIDRAAAASLIKFDDKGIPYAASVRNGLGLPIFMLGPNFTIKLDSNKVEHCVAYDRRAGFVWSFSFTNGKIDYTEMKKHFGVVTVERRQ